MKGSEMNDWRNTGVGAKKQSMEEGAESKVLLLIAYCLLIFSYFVLNTVADL